MQTVVAQAPSEAETRGGGSVLVVEDNPDVAEVTISMLEQLGYRPVAVADADAALDRIAKHDFDLVISDIVGRVHGWYRAFARYPRTKA